MDKLVNKPVEGGRAHVLRIFKGTYLKTNGEQIVYLNDSGGFLRLIKSDHVEIEVEENTKLPHCA